MSKEGKITLVTGGGSGVGRSAAQALIKAGYSVIVTGRRADPLYETLELANAPDRTLAVPADVSDPDSVAALFAKIKETYGRLDVVFIYACLTFPILTFRALPFVQ